ncbi:MAG: hypothetical protein TE42_08335 [Candidatus Synechococcus spongiarum SP3]|uniref:Uncharacterized protein n=1 Tax=Candidatus Synechococcus spongiarum SP3 TaxID=1604020 RepID=A0A0G2HJR6_9SYNE|nr:MAG: hypothetical protein TE42_08335 [Candidatus Synechococcus spongiarum SP3]
MGERQLFVMPLSGIRVMKDFRTEVKRDLASVSADVKDFKAEVKGDLADLRADNRALNDRLDQLLEVFLAGKS